MKERTSDILTIDEAIAKFCPAAKTIEELFNGDEPRIIQTCKALNCSRTEVMINASEIRQLIKNAPIDNNSKKHFNNLISTTTE